MSQTSWGSSQQNRRTLVIGGHKFTKKNRKQRVETFTGSVKDGGPINAKRQQ